MFEKTLPILTQQAPPYAKLNIKLRKTPASVVMMKQHVNITPYPSVINLQDLVMHALVQTAKPDEKIPTPSVPKLLAPPKRAAGSLEEKCPETNVSKKNILEYVRFCSRSHIFLLLLSSSPSRHKLQLLQSKKMSLPTIMISSLRNLIVLLKILLMEMWPLFPFPLNLLIKLVCWLTSFPVQQLK